MRWCTPLKLIASMTFTPCVMGQPWKPCALLARHCALLPPNLKTWPRAVAMLVGSCLAGVSFLKGLGLVHAISHMVGAIYNTHHGLTNAILLPVILRFNEHAITSKLPEMSFALGLQHADFPSFYAAICELLDELEIPVSLSEIGVDDSRISEIAIKASKDAAAFTNPRQASIAELEALIGEAIARAR